MPSNPRPKDFYAVRDFSVDGTTYRTGDVVPHGTLLRRLIAWGGFVTDQPKTEEESNG